MLRKMLSLCLTGMLGLSALALPSLVRAQTVDEILAKHFEAMGGLDKLKALNTVRVTGTMTMGQGMEAPITLEHKRPDKRRVEFQVQGMTGIRAFDGEKSWSLLPFMGKKDPEVGSDEDNKNEKEDSDFESPLVDWKAKGNTVELAGKEPVEGADAFKLKVTKKNGNVEYHYLDAETYLLVKTEGKVRRRGTEIEGESLYSDYKDVNGYMMPFSIEQGAKGMPARQKMTFAKIEVNVPLDDARFAMPGAPAGAAPAAGAASGAAAAADSTKADAKPVAAQADTSASAGEKKDADKKAATAKAGKLGKKKKDH